MRSVYRSAETCYWMSMANLSAEILNTESNGSLHRSTEVSNILLSMLRGNYLKHSAGSDTVSTDRNSQDKVLTPNTRLLRHWHK
jgi:hypothetical protein